MPTCDLARRASANMDFIVSAVAVPDGNLSCDSNRKWRRKGTAKNTPRNATDAPQVIKVHTEYRKPSRCRAGIGPMRPAAMVIEPAALATVWQTFASSCVNGILGFIALNNPMLTAAANTLRKGTREGKRLAWRAKRDERRIGDDGLMERSTHLPPWPHPAFSPKLTFIADTTNPTIIPAITARGLSGSTASYVGASSPDASRPVIIATRFQPGVPEIDQCVAPGRRKGTRIDVTQLRHPNRALREPARTDRSIDMGRAKRPRKPRSPRRRRGRNRRAVPGRSRSPSRRRNPPRTLPLTIKLTTRRVRADPSPPTTRPRWTTPIRSRRKRPTTTPPR